MLVIQLLFASSLSMRQCQWVIMVPKTKKSSLTSERRKSFYRGNESIYLHRSGPLLEDGLNRPKNRYGRFGFASFSSISISTVGLDGARVSLWRFSFVALWVVVVDISEFPVLQQSESSLKRELWVATPCLWPWGNCLNLEALGPSGLKPRNHQKMFPGPGPLESVKDHRKPWRRNNALVIGF